MSKANNVFVVVGTTVDGEILVDVFDSKPAAQAHIDHCWVDCGEDESVEIRKEKVQS